jgi:hypothetical protein
MLENGTAYAFVLPSTIRSGPSLEMKSSSDGPCARDSAKVVFFDADGPDVVGVASMRTCLDTETRTTRE